MKLIIYRRPDNTVDINGPYRGETYIGADQHKFINDNCVDKLPAMPKPPEMLVVEEFTVAQRDCLWGRIITTESGTVEEDGKQINLPAGSIYDRYRAAVAGIAYDELEKEIVDHSAFDDDRMFRLAWRFNKSKKEKRDIDIPAAQVLAHQGRRYLRAVARKPIDNGNPNIALNEEGEAKLKVIMDKDAAMRDQIDAATSVAQLKTALGVVSS